MQQDGLKFASEAFLCLAAQTLLFSRGSCRGCHHRPAAMPQIHVVKSGLPEEKELFDLAAQALNRTTGQILRPARKAILDAFKKARLAHTLKPVPELDPVRSSTERTPTRCSGKCLSRRRKHATRTSALRWRRAGRNQAPAQPLGEALDRSLGEKRSCACRAACLPSAPASLRVRSNHGWNQRQDAPLDLGTEAALHHVAYSRRPLRDRLLSGFLSIQSCQY